MLSISKDDIIARLKLDNPWWEDADSLSERDLPKRSYFEKFYALATDLGIRRAVILMGPRRVGKTVIIKQTIDRSIQDSIVPANNILFVSLDSSLYEGLSLEQILKLFFDEKGLDEKSQAFIFFDEIQYLQKWEVQLKNLVDTYPNIKFIASGSAAAALKLKSDESGAGRFTDFMLPPLTFPEFIHFSGKDDLIVKTETSSTEYEAKDINKLNEAFVEYINFGGYPEVVMNESIRNNMERFIQQDIIDKVLLRDLPFLYGINNMQELRRLFSLLAYNTGNELSPEALSKESQIARSQLDKYLEYLEAAFLIVTVGKINETGKHLKRRRNFKVYLTNASMRAALFAPVSESEKDKVAMGALTETAIFSQWFHSPDMSKIHYARWRGGEVDLVMLDNSLKPAWAYEIKWSDRFFDRPGDLKNLIKFSKDNDVRIGCSTKTKSGSKTVRNVTITYFPSSLYCYQIGKRVTNATT